MDSDNILKKFNLGYLISFDWKSAICPCGTLLNKNDQHEGPSVVKTFFI